MLKFLFDTVERLHSQAARPRQEHTSWGEIWHKKKLLQRHISFQREERKEERSRFLRSTRHFKEKKKSRGGLMTSLLFLLRTTRDVHDSVSRGICMNPEIPYTWLVATSSHHFIVFSDSRLLPGFAFSLKNVVCISSI